MICLFSKPSLLAAALAFTASTSAIGATSTAAVGATNTAKEAGVDKVPLILTEKYNPKKESGRGFTEFTSSLGLLTFGNLYRATAMDVEKMLLEKLSLPELRAYFPSESERRKLASKIADRIDRDHLKGGLTNDKVIAATRYAADELLSLVIRRAMAAEGIKSADRQAVWVKKILSPFRACMNSARTYHEGNKCLDAAQEDAVKNIGLGIAYEMIRQEMGPGYTNGIAAPYQKCLDLKKPGANDRAKGCVLNLVRKAAANYGIDKVKEAAAPDAAASATAIAKSVRPGFEKCLAKASERDGFAQCADSLIIQAGGEIAAAAVMANPHVKTYFPEMKERRALAEAGKNQFLGCMEKNRAAKKRDESGNLSTANCVQLVRLETARGVTHALIEANLEKLTDLKDAERKKLQAQIGRGLDECWDSTGTDEKNNACMKNSIESLVGEVAEIKLANRIPPAMRAQEPKLMDKLVSTVRACIRRDLPDNVMHSNDAAKKVDSCAGELTREAALKVAAFELRQVIHGKTTNTAAADALVKNLVDTELAACLGKAPSDATLAKCSTQLKKGAAIAVGELLFAEEFGRFVDKNGGPATLGVAPAEKERVLADLLAKHRLCLNQNIKGDEGVDQKVDVCFKQSIEMLAGYLGKTAFRKTSREHVTDAKTLENLSGRFEKDLSSCLKEKSDPKFTLNDFVAHIDRCANRLTSTYTLELGSQQVNAALSANLTSPALAARRESLQKELVSQFSLCLGKSEAKESRDACVASLKKQATKEIAMLAARQQALELLNGGKLPPELDGAEKQLEECTAGKSEADLCARRHAQSVAKILGTLKLKVTLGSALGSDKYKSSGRSIASLESGFLACIDAIPGDKPDAVFMKALKACGDKMEAAGISLVQSSLAEWMDSPKADTLEIQLRQEAANAIPCLGPILPSGPVSEDALKQLDPEGILQNVAEVIGDYINYDASRADKHFDQVLKQVLSDLEAAGPVAARQNLFDLLIKEGMVDQLLKSMVRTQVRASLEALPEDERLDPALQALLLDKSTLEAAFTPQLMNKLRPFMAENLLKPLLVEGKTLSDPAPKAALRQIEKQVAEGLLESPVFGDRLVAGAVQQQIDRETSYTLSRWFARSIGYSYDWSTIRGTEGGRTAEAYVKNKIILPMVTGEQISAEELAARRKEASRLVTAAVKNQP